jgi:ketosteroid isomerase-like protein
MIHANTLRLLLPLAFAIALVACKPAATDTGADTAALSAAADGWEKAYNDKNADGVAALYADDAQVLPDTMPAVIGHEAIQKFFVNDIATNWVKFSVKADSTEVAGDWGWRSGHWSVETTPAIVGKYIEVWHRTSAGWKIHRDIWNTDAPLPPPAPATSLTPATPGTPSVQ